MKKSSQILLEQLGLNPADYPAGNMTPQEYADLQKAVDDRLKSLLRTGRKPLLADVHRLGDLSVAVTDALINGVSVNKPKIVEACLYACGLTPDNWEAYHEILSTTIDTLANKTQKETDEAEQTYGPDSPEFKKARRNQIIQPRVEGKRLNGTMHSLVSAVGEQALRDDIEKQRQYNKKRNHRTDRREDELNACVNPTGFTKKTKD